MKIRVTDATVDEVRQYLNNITDILQWEKLQENSQRKRYRVYIHPKVLAIRPGMRSKYRDFFVNEYGATVVSSDLAAGKIVMDFAADEDLTGLAQQVRYDLEEIVHKARYRVDPAVIDIVVGQGGWAATTKSQLSNNMIDRLA